MAVVDVWESEAAFRAMFDDPQFQQGLQESGAPPPASLEIGQIHNTM